MLYNHFNNNIVDLEIFKKFIKFIFKINKN